MYNEKKETYLTVQKVANLLDRHPKTIQRWFDAGILGGFRHPVNNYRMIPMSEVERILDGCK
ncbi:MAG: helix-turn-helix domain-containing protein [Candidatus Marinimicrobia bacterium]|nr:helix-turn-helix domain-containing protein [Candidatus Neomarinimicrobiota bacterium]